jgi:hypothetical protein
MTDIVNYEEKWRSFPKKIGCPGLFSPMPKMPPLPDRINVDSLNKGG